MEDKKDFYRIFRITKDNVEYKSIIGENGTTREKRSPEQVDEYIKKLYNKQLEILDYGIKMNNKNPKKIKKIEEEKEKLKEAYQALKSEELRKLYDYECEIGKKENARVLEEETAYDFFDISEKELLARTDEENDNIIKNKKDEILNLFENVLKNPDISFSKKQQMELLISKAKSNYELIATAGQRKQYTKLLDEKEQEQIREIRKKEIKAKYSHASEYDSGLIYTSKQGLNHGKKAILRKKLEEPKIILNADNIRIAKIAEIAFTNFTGNSYSYIYEYEILRKTDKTIKKDTVYTDLSLAELEINKKTEEPVNPKYYNCVVNKLLTDELIEGSKYNGGYIGMIRKEKTGNYDTTLGERKLSSSEQEMMTAVMIIQEEKKKEQNKGSKQIKWGR